jgi:multiple sugar transport system permease protein
VDLTREDLMTMTSTVRPPSTSPSRSPRVTTAKTAPRSSRLAALGFVSPLVAYLVLFYAYPLAQNVVMSLHRFDRGTFVHGGAPFVGLDIYRELVAEPRFWTVVEQTAVFTVVSLVFQYAIGLALAVFFHGGGFRFSAVLRGMFLIPWLLPMIVSGTTWQWMMNPDTGVLNALLGTVGVEPVWWLSADNALISVIIANIWLGVPFNLVILYSGLQNIPSDLYEAASLDGAGAWQQFWRITFPLLRPVSLVTLLLGLVYTLKVVDVIWIMTFGTGTSQTLATTSYGMAFGKGSSAAIRYSEASAIGTILLLVALAFGVVYLVAQRRQEA